MISEAQQIQIAVRVCELKLGAYLALNAVLLEQLRECRQLRSIKNIPIETRAQPLVQQGRRDGVARDFD